MFLLVVLMACHRRNKKPSRLVDSRYDMGNPILLKLPNDLNGISGISYYQKDSTLFAIVDDDGLFFKIPLNTKDKVKSWRFDSSHDFEDIARIDSIFYVLVSNGNIETIRFNKTDSIFTTITNFPDSGKKNNEFESLLFDDSSHNLLLICKKCEDDQKKSVSAWQFNPNTKQYTPSAYSIDMSPVEGNLGENKARLKPSGAAVNPLSGDIYVLAAVNHLLLITGHDGKIKEFFKLDPAIYEQPEGITFVPNGDMIISNESHKGSSATILIIKNKKKGS